MFLNHGIRIFVFGKRETYPSIYKLFIFKKNKLKSKKGYFTFWIINYSQFFLTKPFPFHFILFAMAEKILFFGSNFLTEDFDGFTCYEIPWIRKSHFKRLVCVYVGVCDSYQHTTQKQIKQFKQKLQILHFKFVSYVDTI